MAKRVTVVLSGCGAGDGSEIREAVLTLLSLERAGAQVTWAAPDVVQPGVFDHLTGAPDAQASPRRALVEAARIARGAVRDLASLSANDFDGLIFPGGHGVGSVLSNYEQKGALCDVEPSVARLMKEALARHRPMGFICLAPILAARVLGPVAGVRVTLGPRGTTAAKNAAVMGADVRPCAANEVFVDTRNRVISTPAYMYDDVRVTEAAQGIEKLVRSLLQLTSDRRPAPPPPPGGRPPRSQAQPGERPGRQGPGQGRGGEGGDPIRRRRPGGPPTPARGSV